MQQIGTQPRTLEQIANDFRVLASKLEKAHVRGDLESAAYMAVASAFDLAENVCAHQSWALEPAECKEAFLKKLKLDI